MKKKIIIIGAVVLIAISVAVVAIGINGNEDTCLFCGDNNDEDIYSNDPYGSALIDSNLFEPEQLNRSIENLALNPVWNDVTQDYRPRWSEDIISDKEFLEIFDDIPKMPQDFYRKYKMFLDGQMSDYDRLGEEYWKQPEFYGLDSGSFNNYIKRNPTMWTIGQVHCRPGFRYVEMKPGNSVSLSTFLHTEVVGTEAYLLGILYSELPDVAMRADGQVIFENPDYANKYIHTKIITPENDELYSTEAFQNNLKGLSHGFDSDEKIILFPASYRIIDVEGKELQMGYQDDWAKKATIKIDVDSKCPKGRYVVALEVRNPNEHILEEYRWSISGAPYYSYVYEAIREWKPTAPYFQVVITVV